MSSFKIRVAEPNIIEEDARAAYDAIMENCLSSGPYVEKFEKDFANYIGVKDAVAVNSGTAALHLPLEALNVRNGDEVITTPFTFAATSNVIVLQNAKPVFVDIEPETYNLDPKKIEKALLPFKSPGTAAFAFQGPRNSGLRCLSYRFAVTLLAIKSRCCFKALRYRAPISAAIL